MNVLTQMQGNTILITLNLWNTVNIVYTGIHITLKNLSHVFQFSEFFKSNHSILIKNYRKFIIVFIK